MPFQFRIPSQPAGAPRGRSAFPSQRRGSQPAPSLFGGGRRATGSSGGLKMRLLIAAAVALFAVISYYAKPGDVNEVTGEPERVAMLDPAEEIRLGIQAAPEMVGQHGGPSRDIGAQQRVQTVGWRLLDGLDRALEQENKQAGTNYHNPYRDAFQFTLLADPRTVNAFALPGGQVFITEALYRALRTEGELAGVLGHEIGHVLARHGNKRMAKQGLYQGLAGAIGVLGGDAESARMAHMVSSVLSMKYGRDHEIESDDWGVRLCGLAGYDPRAMAGVMEVLDSASPGGGPPEFLSTHPKPANRAQYIELAIQKWYPDGVPAGLRP